MFYGRRFFEVYCPVLPAEDFTIVEIGSQNVNGSLREVCPADAKYIGIDLVEGDGVDVLITDPYQLPLPDVSADMVVSSSCFEHSEFFWLVFLEAMRILKPNGVFYLNAPTNGFFHRWPADSWRFYPDSGHALVGWAKRNGYDAMLLESFVGQRSDGSFSEGGMWNDFVAVFLKDRRYREKYSDRIVHSLVDFSNGYSSERPGILNHNEKGPDFSLIDELMKELEARALDMESLSKTVDERDAQIARLCETVAERDRQIARNKDETIHLESQNHSRMPAIGMIESHQSIRQVLIAANKKTDAVFAIEKLIESYDDYAPGHNELGVLYCETGNPEKALVAYQKAVSLDPGNVTFRKNLADFLHVVMKQPEEAIRHYEKVLELNPKETESHMILGNLRIANHEFDAAKDCFLNVLEMDPSHELAGKMLDALDSKLLGHEDDDFESHLREARVRVRRGQIDGANSLLVNLLDNYPDNAAAHNELGNLYCLVQNLEGALIHLSRAVELDPHKIRFLRDLADTYLAEMGNVEEALKLYNRALALEPDSIDTLLIVGNICAVRKQFEDARYFYNRVMALDQDNSQAKENLEVLKKMTERGWNDVHCPEYLIEYRHHSNKQDSSSRFYAMEVANLRKELKEKDNIIHNLLLKLQEIEKNSKKNQISSFFPKVSIVIPVFNKLNFTRRCIELLIRNTNSGLYEIVIVDNGSSDGTTTYLHSLASQFKIIYNHANLGFSQACNQGIRAATAPYILFLNNDTEPQPGWLEPLIEILDNDHSVAAVGSKLLFPDRTIQHAGVVIALQESSGQICPFHIFYKEKDRLAAANVVTEFAACTAACLIVRADRLRELGGFDENFWNGYEDVDLCLRLGQSGWRVVYQPKSVLIHHESQSGPERFSRQNQNIELLQRKWRNKVSADIVIKPDGQIIHQENTRIRPYTADERLTNSNRAQKPQAEKRFPLPCVTGLTSIVILTFNQLKFTKECVESIRKHTPEPHEILFVDNGSSDGSVKWLRKLVDKNSNYQLIENKENLGFSKGCNQGIEASSGEYIVLLNNDVVVTENWLGGMLECLNHVPDIGIVGPITNNISGPQKVPSVNYSAIHKLDEYSRAFRTQNRHRRIPNRRIVGFCMLFRRQLAEEIGLLDESFGSGNFEDDDLCLRAVLAGYRNMIAGDVFIHHYGSQTFIGNGIDYGSSLSGNRRIFIEKWSGEEVAQRFGGKLIVENAVAKADELFGKGDIEKATACMLGALKQAPQDRSLYFKIAEMLIDVKRYQDAVDILDALHPNDPDPIRPTLLGYCEEALGKNERAQELAELALAVDPRAALPMNVRGVIAFKKGECDAAEGWFRKAIEADPGFGESYTNLGSLKWAAGDTEEAMNLFERGFILSPTINDVAAAYHRAVVEIKSFETTEAVFSEAMALHPNHKRIVFLMIALLLQQGKHESALPEIEKAMIQFGIDEGILSACLEIRNKIGPIEIDRPNRKRATVSVCIIVKNEEQHLAKCLMSVKPIVDEMIVVDTGSTDQTKTIATALGAKVYDYSWKNDFSEARNYSLSKASGDWILVLDADEVVSPLDYATLRKIARKHPAKRVAYSMVTRNYTNNPGSGGWVANEGRYAEEEAGKGWVSSTKVRLFVNDKRIQFVNPVHELVEPTLSKLGIKIKTCDVPVHHYGKLDPDMLIAKGKKYYRLGIAKIEQTQGNYNALKELAIQASEIGEYEEAVKVWRKAIELQPNDAGAHMNMGFAFLMMRQYDSAIHFSKIAMQLDPELREAALNYAGAEMIAGDVYTAVSTLEHLLEKHPDYPPAMGRLVAAYIVSGREEEGFQYIQKLNSKGFDGASALEEQARAFMAEAKFETAVLLLAAAIEKGIGNGSMNNLLAECRSKIDGSAANGNSIDFSRSLQGQPDELNGNSAAL